MTVSHVFHTFQHVREDFGRNFLTNGYKRVSTEPQLRKCTKLTKTERNTNRVTSVEQLNHRNAIQNSTIHLFVNGCWFSSCQKKHFFLEIFFFNNRIFLGFRFSRQESRLYTGSEQGTVAVPHRRDYLHNYRSQSNLKRMVPHPSHLTRPLIRVELTKSLVWTVFSEHTDGSM